MKQCKVNVIGYVKLVGYRWQEHVVLPFVWKNDKEVFAINTYGDLISVEIEYVEIL